MPLENTNSDTQNIALYLADILRAKLSSSKIRFEMFLKKLAVASKGELLSQEINNEFKQALEYIVSYDFPEQRKELFRRLAHQLTKNPAADKVFRTCTNNLDILRIMLYLKQPDNKQLMVAVFEKIFDDLKLRIQVKQNQTNTQTNNAPVIKESSPYSSEERIIWVSVGTGRDFFNEIQEGEQKGYNLEDAGTGIFVSPHECLNENELEARTFYYAQRTPYQYFDFPIKVEFQINTKYLQKVNANSYEAGIFCQDFDKVFKNNETIKISDYPVDYLKNIPGYFLMPRTLNDISKDYPEKIADELKSYIKGDIVPMVERAFRISIRL